MRSPPSPPMTVDVGPAERWVRARAPDDAGVPVLSCYDALLVIWMTGSLGAAGRILNGPAPWASRAGTRSLQFEEPAEEPSVLPRSHSSVARLRTLSPQQACRGRAVPVIGSQGRQRGTGRGEQMTGLVPTHAPLRAAVAWVQALPVGAPGVSGLLGFEQTAVRGVAGSDLVTLVQRVQTTGLPATQAAVLARVELVARIASVQVVSFVLGGGRRAARGGYAARRCCCTGPLRCSHRRAPAADVRRRAGHAVMHECCCTRSRWTSADTFPRGPG